MSQESRVKRQAVKRQSHESRLFNFSNFTNNLQLEQLELELNFKLFWVGVE